MQVRKFFVILLIFASCQFVLAQNSPKQLNSVDLPISDIQWTLVKFPSNVSYADIGSNDIEVQKTSFENILQIRAIVAYFDTTNVSVVTANGKFYSFRLGYNIDPPFIAVNMEKVKDNTIRTENTFKFYNLELSTLQTTHIIFNERINHIAVGTDSIISELADKTSNITRAKSVSEDIYSPMTVTYIGESQTIYPFKVTYNASPKSYNFSIADFGDALFDEVNTNDIKMQKMAETILRHGATINDIGVLGTKTAFGLRSIFVQEDLIAFYLTINNDSGIDYAIDFIKTYIVDKKKNKKTAQQETEIHPIFVYNPKKTDIISGKTSHSEVWIFQKFTIPKNRVLNFEVFEKRGGRHMLFQIEPTDLFNAKQYNKIVNN